MDTAPRSEAPELRVTVAGGPAVTAGSRTQLTIGSDASCSIVVSGPAIVGTHLSLGVERGLWIAADTSGGNTFLHGLPIDRLVVLTALELRLGDPEHGLPVSIDPTSSASTQPASSAAPAGPPPAAVAAPTQPPRLLPAAPPAPASLPLPPPTPYTAGRGAASGSAIASAAAALDSVLARTRLAHVLLALVVVVPLIVWAFHH